MAVPSLTGDHADLPEEQRSAVTRAAELSEPRPAPRLDPVLALLIR